jgi:hypothetical protein
MDEPSINIKDIIIGLVKTGGAMIYIKSAYPMTVPAI